MEANNAWQPPAGMTSHGGYPIRPDMDFFAAPPPEIGEVVSACSSLKQQQRPFSYVIRVLISLAAAGAMMLVGELLMRVLNNPVSYNGPMRIMFAVFGSVTAIVAFFALRFKHTCTYLGKQGAAEFKLSGSRHATPKERVLVFDQVDHLLTGSVKLVQYGIHTQTHYGYSWVDTLGKKHFTLGGEARKPKAYDPYHFAVAVEEVWTDYVLGQLIEQWKDHKTLEFKTGSGTLRMVVGGFEYDNRRYVKSMAFDEVVIDIKQGMIDFMPPNAGWYPKPLCSFELNKFGNVRAFLVCLDEFARAAEDSVEVD